MKKLTLAILAVWLAMAGDVSAQSIPGGGTGAANIPETAFANAPSSPPVGTVRFFTDTDGSNCAGGGSTKLLCEYNGSAWVVVGNGTVTTTGGDVFGPASSVDSELAIFSSTSGKAIKRATGTGIPILAAGVLSSAGNLSGDITSSGLTTTIGAGKVVNSMIAASTIDLATKVTGLLPTSSMPALSGDISTSSGGVVTTIGAGKVTNAMLAGSIDLSTKITGLLPTTSMPALTGDVTTISGGVVTSIGAGKVTNAMLAGSITSAKLASTSGLGTMIVVASGTLTDGCAQWSNGNLNSTGVACGSGGGGGGASSDIHVLTTTTEGTLTSEANLGLLTTGLLKITVANGVATPTTAASGFDYAPPTSGTNLLKGNNTGGFSTANAADVVARFTGTPNGAQFLRDDGILATPAGSGNVSTSTMTSGAFQKATGSTAIGDGPIWDCTNNTIMVGASCASAASGHLEVGDTLLINQTAPSAPASGKVLIFADSTAKVPQAKNDAGTLSTMVVADTGASNNFLTGITTAGVITKAQPASTNLSDTAVIVRMNAASTWTTGAQDMSAATSWKMPVAAGATTSAKGHMIYDSTADQVHIYINATDRIIPFRSTSTPTSGNCAQWGANGLLGDSGSGCGGGGGGSGTVTSSLTGNVGWFASDGTTIIGNANLNMSSSTLTVGVAGSAKGCLVLAGNTSGAITICPQAAAGTFNYNLPTSAGSSGQPLLSAGGAGNPMTFGTLGVAAGGTGITSGTSGGVPYFSGSTTIASSAALTANLPVIGGGAGSAPTVGTVLGSGTKFVTAGAGTPSTDDCAKFDSSHNLVSAGAGCNTSSLTTLGALIYASANQSIPTSTNTAILFNGEVRDDGTLHSTVSNTSKIVIPTGGHGWWHFSGHVAYSTASQTGLRYLWVSRNGIDNVVGPCRSNKDSLNSSSELNVSCDYYASDADEFELVVHQQSGGSLDVLSTTSGSEKVSPTFSAVRVSQ